MERQKSFATGKVYQGAIVSVNGHTDGVDIALRERFVVDIWEVNHHRVRAVGGKTSSSASIARSCAANATENSSGTAAYASRVDNVHVNHEKMSTTCHVDCPNTDCNVLAAYPTIVES